jgi:phosphomannomutase
MITASHYPAHYNGFKWTPYWGGPAIPAVTDDIETRASALTIAACDKFIPFRQAVAAGLVKEEDFHHSYFAQLYSLLDVSALKKARLNVATDSICGTVRTYLRPALEKVGAKVVPLREHRDVNFGGRPPDIDESNLAGLRQAVLKGRLSLGLACDGDGDRFGVIDSDGTWITPNEVLALLLDHLVRNRGLKGKVARSIMTSHFVDAVAKANGLEVRETPVGFKYIGNLLRTGQFLIGGEASGGLSIMNHVPEKDGILACMLLAELYAYERKPLKKVLADLRKRVGTFLNTRVDIRLRPDADVQALAARLTTEPPLNLGGTSVWRIDHTDGFKFIMRDGSWLGLRPSGTEPVVRVHAEAATQDKLGKLVEAGKKIASGKF